MEVLPSLNIGEVGIKGLCVWEVSERFSWQGEGALEEPVWTAGVHEKAGVPRSGLALALACQFAARPGEADVVEGGLVEVFDTHLLCSSDEKMVEVRAVPVGIGDIGSGAGGDEELAFMVRRVCPLLVEAVVVEAESTFQAAGDMWVSFLPATPFGKGRDIWQIVALGELFQEKICEGS